MVNAGDMGRALVAAVALERALEQVISRRNERRLRAAGAVEAGRGHYPAMVAFHAGLLVACVAEPVAWPGAWPWPIAIAAAGAVLAAQALRWWAVSTLGGRWSTRVLVLPGASPVRSGPYRWLRHPNYLAVIAEVAALPLACGAWRTAVLGTVLNAGLMAARIRAEEGAMGEGWGKAFEGVPRLVPRAHPDPKPNLNPASPNPGQGREARVRATGSGDRTRAAGSGSRSGSGDGSPRGPHDPP